jgi:hypothetical protein
MSIFNAPTFYSAPDRQTYSSGNFFIPQEKYTFGGLPRQVIPTGGITATTTASVLPRRILPFNQDSGGDDNIITGTKDPYGYTGPGSSRGTFNIEDIAEGTIDDDDIIRSPDLTKAQLAKAYANYAFLGPFAGAYSLHRASKENEQAEIDRINQEIALQYGSLGGIGAEEAQKRQDEAGGSVQSSEDYGSYGGKGDQGATGANFSGEFATDSASYDLAEGGRVGYMGGGITNLVDIYD